MRGYRSPRWQPDEIEYLDTILHEHTNDGLVKRLQAWQKKHGRPIRSDASIRQKAYVLGKDKAYQEDNLSFAQLAKILGIDRSRIKTWRSRLGLPVSQQHKNREVSISVADFKKWATEHTSYLHGIDRERLSYFLPDRVLDLIPTKSPFHCPVRCVETGQTFETATDAVKAIGGVYVTTLRRAIESGSKCGGYHWERS